MTGGLYQCLSASADGVRAGLSPFSKFRFIAGSCVFETVVVVALTASQPVWMTGRLFQCLSASSDGIRAGLTPQLFSQPEVHSHHPSVEQEQEIEIDSEIE